VELVALFDKKMRRKYYEVCGVVEKKLLLAGYERLNDYQCRYICEHLQLDRKMKMSELKNLGSIARHVKGQIPGLETPESQQTLFD
jgi:hypothetical protein